jgi:hypothetical protein
MYIYIQISKSMYVCMYVSIYILHMCVFMHLYILHICIRARTHTQNTCPSLLPHCLHTILLCHLHGAAYPHPPPTSIRPQSQSPPQMMTPTTRHLVFVCVSFNACVCDIYLTLNYLHTYIPTYLPTHLSAYLPLHACIHNIHAVVNISTSQGQHSTPC